MMWLSRLHGIQFDIPAGQRSSRFLEVCLRNRPDTTKPQALPRLAEQVVGQNTYLTLKYRQLMVPGKLVYRVGVSGDLAGWDDSETDIEQIGYPIPTGDGLTEEVTVRLTVPLVTLNQAYLRLNVMQMP